MMLTFKCPFKIALILPLRIPACTSLTMWQHIILIKINIKTAGIGSKPPMRRCNPPRKMSRTVQVWNDSSKRSRWAGDKFSDIRYHKSPELLKEVACILNCHYFVLVSIYCYSTGNHAHRNVLHLIHWGRVMHMCISKLGHHWLR